MQTQKGMECWEFILNLIFGKTMKVDLSGPRAGRIYPQ
jgi:hypothetical protein